jgi:FlaA1/EpsC-like NDP-sugar epimerase
VFIIDWLGLTVMLLGYRMVLKTLHQLYMKGKDDREPSRVALIWGSGEQGLWCLRYLNQSQNPRYEVMGFIDDEVRLHHKRIDGLPVLGDHHHLEILTHLYRVEELFVAMPRVSPQQLESVQELCQRLNVAVLRFLPRTVQEISPPPPAVEQTGEPSFFTI